MREGRMRGEFSEVHVVEVCESGFVTEMVTSSIDSSETGTMGRATLDVRVCASPGRDKTVEEKKWRQRKSNSATVGQESVGRRGRKRGGGTRLVPELSPPSAICTIVHDL